MLGLYARRSCMSLARPFIRTYATQVNKGGASDSATYCRALVQKHDYESYLTSYFYPRALQPAYFAIRAFNVELAMVKEQVSNTAIGRMRMQFWRDSIKSIYEDRPPQHPIALALHQATKVAPLSAYHFKRIIDARDADLENPTHISLTSLRAYSESTSSTINYLLLSLLSINNDTSSHAASHLGLASTLTTLLRALPFHASRHSNIVIPSEITAKHGVTHEDVIRYGGAAEGISAAVFEFACIAKEELDVAREEMLRDVPGGKVPMQPLPVFLSGIPAASYLERLEAVDFDAFHPSLQVRDWKLPFRIWRQRSKRMF